MAKSTKITENLTEAQLVLFKYLEDHEILYFKLEDLALRLPQGLSKNINELVENLYQKDLLYRIERGVYARTNYTNINVLATFISPDGGIAYWSALHHHSLTERFPNTTFVKTTRRKRETRILSSSIRFVTVKRHKNIGMIREGYGDDSFPITDVEMTLVDCFDQARYAGDFADLIKAFANAKLTNAKLMEYTRTYDNTALTKRLGYLATLFHQEKLQNFINYAQARINEKYSLMDAGGPQQGEFIREWKLRLNISRENLLHMAQTEY